MKLHNGLKFVLLWLALLCSGFVSAAEKCFDLTLKDGSVIQGVTYRQDTYEGVKYVYYCHPNESIMKKIPAGEVVKVEPGECLQGTPRKKPDTTQSTGESENRGPACPPSKVSSIPSKGTSTSGQTRCSICKGTGSKDCIHCVNGQRKSIDGGWEPCVHCGGQGHTACTFCNGTGGKPYQDQPLSMGTKTTPNLGIEKCTTPRLPCLHPLEG